MFISPTASGRGAVPVRNGAGRPAERDSQEIHLWGNAPVQATQRRRVGAELNHCPSRPIIPSTVGKASACELFAMFYHPYLKIVRYLKSKACMLSDKK